jgi:hypothetical protein
MITVYKSVREGTVWFKSGHFYRFLYQNYENDPGPVIVMLNYIKGTHPTTGHYHNYIQAINFSYIPRQFRRLFVDQWGSVLKANNGNVLLTWKKVRSRFPYLQFALRRYFIGKGFIKFQHEVPEEDFDQVIISSFSRDFSLAAWKASIKMRAGKKGGKNRLNLANKPLSRNPWILKKAFAPVI